MRRRKKDKPQPVETGVSAISGPAMPDTARMRGAGPVGEAGPGAAAASVVSDPAAPASPGVSDSAVRSEAASRPAPEGRALTGAGTHGTSGVSAKGPRRVGALQRKLLETTRTEQSGPAAPPELQGLGYDLRRALQLADREHGFERDPEERPVQPSAPGPTQGPGSRYDPQRVLREVARANGIADGTGGALRREELAPERTPVPDEHANMRPSTAASATTSMISEPDSMEEELAPGDDEPGGVALPISDSPASVASLVSVSADSLPSPQQAEIVLPWVLENSFGNSLQRAIVVELLRSGELPVGLAEREKLLDVIPKIADIITKVIRDVEYAPSISSAVQARLSSLAGQGEASIASVGPDDPNAMPWLVLIRWLPSDALRNRALQLLRGEIPREENEEVLGTIHELAVAATRLIEAQRDVDALRSLYSLAISAGQAIDPEPPAQEPGRPGSTINSPRSHRPHQRHAALPPVNEPDIPGNASTRSGSSGGSGRFYTPDPGEPPPGSPDTTR
ncbi:hypothetical protein [Noviherbaspirillum aridicola]|nr:hypothetical protein [Noviherbaspirillum aridicola]